MRETYDGIVVGGGIMGCSVAWQLERKQKRVLVIERRDVASGAVGATDGVVGYHTQKPGPQMDLAVQSIAMFETLGEQLGQDIEYGLPLLEPVHALPGFYMAAGHEGDGIALSPITGKLIAEWIVDGKPSYDLSDFDPNRFLKA